MEAIEDRDSKKPFVIPKTHASNKDVFISEKTDSRNVMELFNDIKSCALETQFDYRQNDCKSCDTIRNPKLQKLYNEKRQKLKKEQEPIERLAFQVIVQQDAALRIATDGLSCEQLSLPFGKYLGNPKEGVHLSKRPDVLLMSTGAQGLQKFGLLVCKILLGKGYATIPSTANDQLAAQLHYDHHFCKVQSFTKEQRHMDDLFANSLLYCYEHDNFQPISHPSQILPIAILWYQLKEKFSLEMLSSTSVPTTIKITSHQEPPHRNGKVHSGRGVVDKKLSISKPSTQPPVSSSPLKTGTCEKPKQASVPVENAPVPSTPEVPTTKYPSQFMVPYHRPYSHPSQNKALTIDPLSTGTSLQIAHSRDPRLLRAQRETASVSSETIPLSPQHLLLERALSEHPFSSKFIRTSPGDSSLLLRSSSLAITIPLNSNLTLTDPRLATVTSTRTVFFLELQAVKHAQQQQKRLNHYHDATSGLAPKTSYFLVPYLARQVSADEYERLWNHDQTSLRCKKPSHTNSYSSLHVSVVDCFNFGFSRTSSAEHSFIDLEEDENRIAFDQLETNSDLLEREGKLNSQQRRLRLRERRHRRRLQHINERRGTKSKSSSSSNSPPASSIISPHSKINAVAGRQMLKDYPLTSALPNAHVSSDLLEFFSREYRHETRSRVKHLLAELVGVFIEKYHLNQHLQNPGCHQNGEDKQQVTPALTIVEDRSLNVVIDMDIDSSPSQGMGDYDERFRTSPLPPLYASAPIDISITPSSILTHASLNGTNGDFDYSGVTDPAHPFLLPAREPVVPREGLLSTPLLVTKVESVTSMEGSLFQACLDQLSSSSEQTVTDESSPLNIAEDLQQGPQVNPLNLIHDLPIALANDSNQSRDEFVKLLTKEALVSKSSSPAKPTRHQKESSPTHPVRRRSFDEDENHTSERRFHRPTEQTNGCATLPNTPKKIISSTRTVTLVSNRTSTTNQPPSVQSTTDESPQNNRDEPAWKRAKIDSISPLAEKVDRNKSGTIPTDEHDCRRDLEERRTIASVSSMVPVAESAPKKSSTSRSPSTSKEHKHADEHRRRRSPSHSRRSSTNGSSRQSNHRSKDYSRPSSSSAHRSSLLDDRPHRPDRNRSSNSNHRYPLSNATDFTDRQSIVPETSYRSSLSSSYRSRPMNDLIVPSIEQRSAAVAPVRHKRFNYNHQSVADHPRFAHPEALAPSTPSTDFDYARLSTNSYRSATPVKLRNRNQHSSNYLLNQIEPFKSTRHLSTQDFDTKPSNAIEQLQMLLQVKSKESSDHASHDISRRTSSKSVSTLPRHAGNGSSTASDRTRQEKFNHPHHDPGQLLRMAQRLRN